MFMIAPQGSMAKDGLWRTGIVRFMPEFELRFFSNSERTYWVYNCDNSRDPSPFYRSVFNRASQ